MERDAMGKRPLLMICSALLLSCGRDPAPSVTSESILLIPTDTIGVEYGDENLTFGFITGAGMTPGGNVAVLDAQKAAIQVFSTDGEQLLSMGGFGSGPGEFRFPMAMAVLPDGFAVSDLTGGKLSFFDGEGRCVRELCGFFPSPPLGIEGTADGSVIGAVMKLDAGEDGTPFASILMASWTGSVEPDVVFHSVPVGMEGGGIRQRPRFNMAAGPEGSVFFAEESDSMLLVLGFSADGSPLMTIREEFQRVPKSEHEMAQEHLSLSFTISNGESSLERTRSRDEEPHRTIVKDIGVDSGGRIWLEMGHTGQLHFRVYTPDGSSFVTAVPDDPEALSRSRFSITPYGFAAAEPDPEDWPKVYVLETVENGREVQE